MTRAVRNRILKDANGDIGDHLRNHIHLTNCIHLKNHMHKHSPLVHDRSLMRDLIVLQRSRSLRDPSASPPPWHSPVIADLFSNSERVGNGRRSVGSDRPRDATRLSGRSPPLENIEIGGSGYQMALGSEPSSKSGAHDIRRARDKESSRNSELLGGNRGPLLDGNEKELSQAASGTSERRSRKSTGKGKSSREVNPKTLSQQLREIPMESDEVVSSSRRPNERRCVAEKTLEEAEPSFRGSCTGLSRVRRRKFRRVKRTPGYAAPRDTRAQNEVSVASNSSVKGTMHQRHPVEYGEEEFDEHNVSRAPRNGCGIPFNWSRIHHRGRSFLDMAGRSLSCGLSDPRSKRGGQVSQGRDTSDLPEALDHSSSCSKSDAEALPLLLDGSGSQGSSDNAAWAHDYSGELGIFADSLLKHEIESDLASEGRSGDQHNLRGSHRTRHQNLTQKYMPRTFRDLVGQNLVAQALCNAVVRRKVGLLYVFYGPHGTGKTSSARIFARALNCQSLEHPKPCGFCGSCIAHDMGKGRNIKEIGPVGNFDSESIMDLLDCMAILQQPSQYRVFIFDDCDALSPDCWSAISKVIDRAPRRVVFILISSSLDVIPHMIISRCQKFFFPKLKDADIIYALEWIATKEGLEIDKDALKLIASRSDGSLRDAEMTLEQLSLLGQRISVSLVQELVGLISDEKLVDLLDLALSADTVNTVKNLREIMESGVEPLALMSQLATVITDILAGSYDLTKERRRRKFFRRQPLSKEDMEKLRQALKTLSEAEKQLRMSNDKLTWLTAALLQLAPDQQYMLPSSAEETSFNHSPLAMNGGRNVARRRGMDRVRMSNDGRRLSTDGGVDRQHARSPSSIREGSKVSGSASRKQLARIHGTSAYDDTKGVNGRQDMDKGHTEIEDIWFDVLGKIQVSSIKEFLYQEGTLISVSYGAAPTVQLMFSSPQTRSKAEKLRAYILQAFESVLGSPVTIEIRGESQKDLRSRVHASQDRGHSGTSEIVELTSSPREQKFGEHVDIHRPSDKRGTQGARAIETGTESGRFGEQNQCRSLVRGKVSLAHVIQQAEGSTSWTKRKAVSIAEKLEQENLRLEPRSRSLLCWKASRATRRKLSRLKIQTRRHHSLLKVVSCGKCLSSRSPR